MLKNLKFFIYFIIIYMCYYHFNYQYTINKRKNVPIKLRRQILIQLYNFIIDAGEATNTKPFLTYGTLLGFIRNKDLICYDFDVDFGIDNSEFIIISKYLDNYIKKFSEYKIIHKNFLNYSSIEIIHIDTRLSVDIFGFIFKNNTCWRNVPKLYSKYYLKEKYVDYPKEWIMPLQVNKFLDRNTYIPNMPEKLLECYYGKNFIIPDHTCNSDCSICKKN